MEKTGLTPPPLFLLVGQKRKEVSKKTARQNHIIISIGAGLLFLLSGLNFSLFLSLSKNAPSVAGATRNLEGELVYWEDIVLQNPQYQQGWIKLSEVKKELGDLEGERVALENAVRIEPNSQRLER